MCFIKYENYMDGGVFGWFFLSYLVIFINVSRFINFFCVLKKVVCVIVQKFFKVLFVVYKFIYI